MNFSKRKPRSLKIVCIFFIKRSKNRRFFWSSNRKIIDSFLSALTLLITPPNIVEHFLDTLPQKDKKNKKNFILSYDMVQKKKEYKSYIAHVGCNTFCMTVMEYLDGGELFEKVATEVFTLTESDCCLFLRQICRGVQGRDSWTKIQCIWVGV